MLIKVRKTRSPLDKEQLLTSGHSFRIAGMTKLFQNHTFIGLVDYDLSLSIVQHETKMFMVNHSAVACVQLSIFLAIILLSLLFRTHLGSISLLTCPEKSSFTN